MSKLATQRLNFVLTAAGAASVAAVVIFFVPSPLNDWLAVAIIGILSCVISKLMGSRRLRHPQSFVSNERAPDTAETWSAEQWKAWASEQADFLKAESEAVASRERRLAEKLARHYEVLEFPVQNDFQQMEDSSAKLSEADRQVQELLEAEAAAVYEKIRSDAYRVDGEIQIEAIRSDLVHLIEQVARVYQPDSQSPLLETSFNQLARAFSRICLHCLVLLEQLPLDIRNYTLNELFLYFQRAAKAYGAYQQVAPWMQRLGRTAYAGRFAAGANPVTLGAWWLASEVAQRGAKHVVSNVIDRQAIAVLHDLVSVVGTEVANIYGPGYRQRDAAWVYGSEITELLSQFPVSRDSLRQALKEITQLPLKSEYDRIYLYRCLATSTAAGFLLTDPSSLTREQRETIAVGLERFINEVLHGIDQQVLQNWASKTELRLDLKLKVGTNAEGTSQVANQQVIDCLFSIWGFCTSVIAVDSEGMVQQLERLQLLRMLPLQQRQSLLTELSASPAVDFSIPDLDPASTLLPIYLQDLYSSSVATRQAEQHHFELLLETAMHFRWSRTDAVQLMATVCRNEVSTNPDSTAFAESLSDQHVIVAAFRAKLNERLIDVFTSVTAIANHSSVETTSDLDDAAVLVFENSAGSSKRIVLATTAFQDHGAWDDVMEWSVQPIEGYVYDDCRLTRLKSGTDSHAEDSAGQWADISTVVLKGSLLNRSYAKRFASLIPPSTNSPEL